LEARRTANEYLQTISNPAVYAAGDAADNGPMLTPVAGHVGRIVATNLLEGNTRRIEYPAVPSVVFTLLPPASVGLQEVEARGTDYASRGPSRRFLFVSDLVDTGNSHTVGVRCDGSGRHPARAVREIPALSFAPALGALQEYAIRCTLDTILVSVHQASERQSAHLYPPHLHAMTAASAASSFSALTISNPSTTMSSPAI
jgi:hypothetical protein